jgi:hypothetical protein
MYFVEVTGRQKLSFLRITYIQGRLKGVSRIGDKGERTSGRNDERGGRSVRKRTPFRIRTHCLFGDLSNSNESTRVAV